MPAVIPAIVSAVVSKAVAAYVGSQIIGAIVGFIVSSLLSSALGKKPKKAEPSFTAESRDRIQVVRSSVATHRVIYGQVMVSGPLVFAGSSGSGNEYLHMVIALAGHECAEIGAVYLNDEAVGTLDGSGNVTDGRFANHVRIKKHLGSASQTADADLLAEMPAQWTVDHRLQGLAYIYIRLKYNQDIFPNGIPNIKAVVKGKKLYDPRTSTTAWSNNWALAIRDYLAGSYGLNCAASEIDDAAIIAAANLADESVAVPDGAGGTVNQARYTCDGTVDTGERPIDIMKGLLTGGAGVLNYTEGSYKLYGGAYAAPSAALTVDDLRDEIEVLARVPRKDLFNGVRGTYVDPAKYWQPSDFPLVKNATYVTQDGGEEIIKDLELPYTTDPYRAQRIAKIHLEKSRQGIVVNFPAKLTAFKLAVWDVVTLTLDAMGWSNKEFRVTGWKLNDTGGVDLVLQEESSASWAWNSGEATVVDPAPDTNLPSPFTVGAPANLAAASGTDHLLILSEGSVISRILFTWDALANAFVSHYEVEYMKAGDANWTPLAPVYRDTRIYVQPVEDGSSYSLRVRGVNSIGVRGAWSELVGHVVVGKTEAPPRPDTFTVSRLADGTRRYAWSLASVPADVRAGGGYKIRYKVGSTSDWSAMTDLHSGILTSSPFENNELAAGTYTWAIKTIDSSGNESVDARFITGEIGDPRLRNVLLQRIEQDLAWPGTRTGCFLHAGILIPASTSTINDLPGAISSLAATINSIGTNTNPIVYETPIIDLGTDVSFTPLVTVAGTGTATITMKTGTTADGTVVGSYVALATVAGKRYVQIKVSMASSAATIESMTTLIDAETTIDEYEDVNTATESAVWFSRTAAGHIKIGSKSGDLAAISSAKIVALQNVGAGWTWELISKTQTVNSQPAAEFKIYNGSATLADAVIDVELKGPKA